MGERSQSKELKDSKLHWSNWKNLTEEERKQLKQSKFKKSKSPKKNKENKCSKRSFDEVPMQGMKRPRMFACMKKAAWWANLTKEERQAKKEWFKSLSKEEKEAKLAEWGIDKNSFEGKFKKGFRLMKAIKAKIAEHPEFKDNKPLLHKLWEDCQEGLMVFMEERIQKVIKENPDLINKQKPEKKNIKQMFKKMSELAKSMLSSKKGSKIEDLQTTKSQIVENNLQTTDSSDESVEKKNTEAQEEFKSMFDEMMLKLSELNIDNEKSKSPKFRKHHGRKHGKRGFSSSSNSSSSKSNSPPVMKFSGKHSLSKEQAETAKQLQEIFPRFPQFRIEKIVSKNSDKSFDEIADLISMKIAKKLQMSKLGEAYLQNSHGPRGPHGPHGPHHRGPHGPHGPHHRGPHGPHGPHHRGPHGPHGPHGKHGFILPNNPNFNDEEFLMKIELNEKQANIWTCLCEIYPDAPQGLLKRITRNQSERKNFDELVEFVEMRLNQLEKAKKNLKK